MVSALRRNDRKTNCYDCGTPCGLVPSCPVCHSRRLTTSGRCRPRLAPVAEVMALPGPWALLGSWPAGCSISISAGPGGGKSSLCSLFVDCWPMTWLTAEETGAQAGRMFRRLYPDGEPPDVVVVRTPAQAIAALAAVSSGIVVLDSLTAIAGWEQQVTLLQHVDEWMLDGPDRRFLEIQQINGRGEAAGRMEIAHLVDACCDIDDDSGHSRLSVWKNRNGPIGSRYFELGAGKPVQPTFPYAYSVEGTRGRYRLLPFPLPGGKFHGYLHSLMHERIIPIGGVATAAIPVPSYPRGLFFPPDVLARRRFAEDHGLVWLPRDGDE